MNKNKKIISAILVVVVLVVFFLLFAKLQNKEAVNENGVQLVVKDSYNTKTLSVEDKYADFDVKYPNFKNASVEFNLEIENLVKKEIEDFQKISIENWQARYDTKLPGEEIEEYPKDNEKFSFFVNFKVVQSNDEYISCLMRYGGFNGGAHGYENIISYNYDVKNKKHVLLENLFFNNKDYLNYLSKESRVYLENQFATATEEEKKNSDPQAIQEYIENLKLTINAGTEPKIENFDIFTFTTDKVTIYFEDYQVGPHSMGMPVFELGRF